MSTLPETTYDAVPYTNSAFRHTHPSFLAAVAALHGLTPTPPTSSRVLELGCGRGGNIVALAEGLPGSLFVGLDLAPRQIADGQALVRQLGLTNLDLRALSILDVDESFGQF